MTDASANPTYLDFVAAHLGEAGESLGKPDDGSLFRLCPDGSNFTSYEEATLAYWEKVKAFETSLEQSKDRPEYTFYDGPPFATGLPHYGHLLAGTIKDIVTRYAHQTGHYVSRRFGWDCHGLPVEFEIDKKLGITCSDDVQKLGVRKYNDECRAIVMRYSSEWKTIVSRMGRWIDFENDYKTLDPNYMESVWWVFKQMYEKGLVYQGFKVMPYSTACTTPLSNFEAGQNYKDVQDPTVTVAFACVDEENTYFLAWTTTPWTLPSNLALCVHPELVYCKVLDTKTKRHYWIAESRLKALYKLDDGKKGGGGKKKKKKNKKKVDAAEAGDAAAPASEAVEADAADAAPYTLVKTATGAELKGRKYEPLFPYFAEAHGDKCFVMLNDTYVTDDSGTGIVHSAPGFGEDDYRICLEAGIIVRGAGVVCPVDLNGRFTDEVPDYEGRHVKTVDRDIIRALHKRERVVDESNIMHSYPFCWRSETPLIYRAVPSWFVNVPSIKAKLLANNEQTTWVPEFVKEKRFHNWLKEARDWSVSRNRYWGTPLPIWQSEDGEEVVVVGSIQELRDLSGNQDIHDIHKHEIDDVTIPSKQGKGDLKRVPEVFDCWFESGSMPYAQQHYPFEHKEKFEAGFPADFIAEGLDQTRGWFYTLMVISTALFDKPAFKNLIVNGLVLASDGKKMSKRLKNYPDPMLIVNKYGSDALRLYLINSPVVRAEPLRFREEGVFDVVKTVLIPWFNVYKFFVTQARLYSLSSGTPFVPDPSVHELKVTAESNTMDVWIMSSLQTLVKGIRAEMKAYKLYNAVPHLLRFLDDLSKWYVRFNKNIMKGDSGVAAQLVSLQTLYEVLLSVCKVMAPFTPFLVEYMFGNLSLAQPESSTERLGSVHYCMVPEPQQNSEVIERQVKTLQTAIDLGRAARDSVAFSFRTPAVDVTIVAADEQAVADLRSLEQYVLDELNVQKVVFVGPDAMTQYVSPRAQPDNKALGQRLKQKARPVCAAIQQLTAEQIGTLKKDNALEVAGEQITLTDVVLSWEIAASIKDDVAAQQDATGTIFVLLNKVLTQECRDEGVAREFINRVQQLRKRAGLVIEQQIDVYFSAVSETSNVARVLALPEIVELVNARLRLTVQPTSAAPTGDGAAAPLIVEDVDINGDAVKVALYARAK